MAKSSDRRQGPTIAIAIDPFMQLDCIYKASAISLQVDNFCLSLQRSEAD